MKTIANIMHHNNFPLNILDNDENVIYTEHLKGFWIKRKYDKYGNEIYYESSMDFWENREYDSNGSQIFYENSNGTLERINQ